jgi:hypothetical protein
MSSRPLIEALIDILTKIKILTYLYSFFKGKQALNPEEDANGALQAARKINPEANTQVIGNC